MAHACYTMALLLCGVLATASEEDGNLCSNYCGCLDAGGDPQAEVPPLLDWGPVPANEDFVECSVLDSATMGTYSTVSPSEETCAILKTVIMYDVSRDGKIPWTTLGPALGVTECVVPEALGGAEACEGDDSPYKNAPNDDLRNRLALAACCNEENTLAFFSGHEATSMGSMVMDGYKLSLIHI